MLGGDETGGISVSYDDQNNHIDFALSSIPNSSLSNSSITINGSSVSLGGTRTLVTDDIAEDGSQLIYILQQQEQEQVLLKELVLQYQVEKYL